MIAKNIIFSFVILSGLMHLFCCGIPLLLSIASISALIGFNGASFAGFEWFEAIEIELFIASGVVLLTTSIFQLISRRIDCRKDGECKHEPCDKKKNYAQKIFLTAVILYCANLTILLFTNDWNSIIHTH